MVTVKKTQGRQLFDAAEYDSKMIAMIQKLRTQKPGTLVGMVGKKEILEPHREELRKLLDEGYTLLQIAELMKSDVFQVLPKTLTEIIQNKVKKARVPKKTKEDTTAAPGASSTPAEPAAVTTTKKQITRIGEAT